MAAMVGVGAAAAAGGVGGGGGDPIAAARAVLEAAGDAHIGVVQSLKDQKRALQQQKTALAKAIRNEDRKRHRIIQKAKSLSTDDLLSVVAARAAAKAKAKGKAKAHG
jgi:hypothetical protein